MRRPNMAPQTQPTVVVVGGASPPQPEPNSAQPQPESTPNEERQEAIQLGAVLEAHRATQADLALIKAQQEAMEARDRERSAQLDQLIATLAEEEAEEETPEVVAITPELEPPPPAEEPPERKPSRWERACNWINGM